MDASRNRSENSKTLVRSFRLTHTQNLLIQREQNRGISAAAIARVLFSLYFNKKIPGVEALVKKEMMEAEGRELHRLNEQRERMRQQGLRKQQGGW